MPELRLPYPPREWQSEALSLWLREMRGVVSVVTGGGKTYFALLCLQEFLRRYPHAVTSIVVPTTALLDQWFVSLQEELGIQSDSIGVFSGDEKSDSPRLINLLVINTARDLIGEVGAGERTFLIVDECHRAASPMNSLVLSGTHTATLGLSATPHREYDDGFERVVEPALGPIVFEYDYEAARKDGVIAPFHLVNIRVNLLPEEQLRFDSLTRAIAKQIGVNRREGGGEEKLKRLLRTRAAVSSKARMRVPVAVKIALGANDRRTLIFHERISDANAIAKSLQNSSRSAGLYHSGIGPTVRRDNLRLYRRGIYDTLVTCRALDEGLNVPETSRAIVASSTASRRQRLQRLGRVLRPSPGKDSSDVVTLYATDIEERRLLSEAQKLVGVASVVWKRAQRRDGG